MRHALFAYGTLQLEEKLQVLLGKIPSMIPATLAGYRAGLVARADFPGIVPSVGHVTHGHVLSPLSHEDLLILDRYEGELYRRTRVTVETGSGLQRCWVYVIALWARPRVTEEVWTIDSYCQRKGMRWTYRS